MWFVFFACVPIRTTRLPFLFGKNLFLEKNLQLPFIFVLFFKRKTKYERKFCITPYLKKIYIFAKAKSKFKDEVTYYEGMVVNRITPLNPYTYESK